ncbi:MAG: FAD-binding oxidoreductase [Solirubrobacteraceae bacterium]
MSLLDTVFPGDRIHRDDPRYATMVRGFNLRWVGQPAYVQVCGDTQQVVNAVQSAVDGQQRVTVRCGGHCYEDFVCDNRDGVIVDLSPMSGVHRCGTDLYCVEGGATLWNVYEDLYRKYGVTLPAGSCYSVGIGGHVTGGGYGLLSRLHGLTIDYLHAVEIVHVNGDGRAQTTIVSADSSDPDERELLWANQGAGGGNFGIVTRFFFRGLPAAPTQAWLSSQSWDWSELTFERFAELIVRYGEFFQANSDSGSPFAGMFALLHLFQRAGTNPSITLTTQYVGSEPKLLDEFTELMAGPLPTKAAALRVGAHSAQLPVGAPQPLPWLFATQTLNGSGPNRRGKYKSAYMLGAFPQRQIETMFEHLSKPSYANPAALLQVDSYGCQVNAVPSDATAIPQRSSVMKLQYQTYWSSESEDQPNLDWIRGFYEDMYGPAGPLPDSTMDGCYVNYPDVDLKDWEHLYYKDSYPRLQRVKARWDPLDIFHHQQSVKAA